MVWGRGLQGRGEARRARISRGSRARRVVYWVLECCSFWRSGDLMFWCSGVLAAVAGGCGWVYGYGGPYVLLLWDQIVGRSVGQRARGSERESDGGGGGGKAEGLGGRARGQQKADDGDRGRPVSSPVCG